MPERSVLLAGMMGSGKSSVGQALARRLRWDFVDTDACIERDAGATIPRIFSTEGEAGFRQRERKVLENLPERRTVIALGGGAFATAENRGILNAKGICVWLDGRPETLVERLGDASDRPLLAGLDRRARVERLRELAAQRAEAYAQAELRVETDGRNVREVEEAVLEALQREDAA